MGLADLEREYGSPKTGLAALEADFGKPAPSGALANLKNLPKLVTEGLPAAGRAVVQSQAEPTYGQALQTRFPGLRHTAIPGTMDVVARLARLPWSLARGVSELGPEQAKPLTEQLAGGLLNLSPLLRRPPAPRPQIVGALPEMRPAAPSVPAAAPAPIPSKPAPLPPAPQGPPPWDSIEALNARREALRRAQETTSAGQGASPVRDPVAPAVTPESLYQLGRKQPPVVPQALPAVTETPKAPPTLKERIATRRAEPAQAQIGDLPKPVETPAVAPQPALREARPEPGSDLPPSGPPAARPAAAPAPVGAWQGQMVTITDGPERGLVGRVERVLPHPTRGASLPVLDIRTQQGGNVQVPSNMVARGKAETPPRVTPQVPRFEQTPIGQQGVIPGAPGRAMPPTLIRKPGQVEITDTPLFGQAKAARESKLAQAQQTMGEAHDPQRAAVQEWLTDQLGSGFAMNLATAKSPLTIGPAVRTKLQSLGIDPKDAWDVTHAAVPRASSIDRLVARSMEGEQAKIPTSGAPEKVIRSRPDAFQIKGGFEHGVPNLADPDDVYSLVQGAGRLKVTEDYAGELRDVSAFFKSKKGQTLDQLAEGLADEYPALGERGAIKEQLVDTLRRYPTLKAEKKASRAKSATLEAAEAAATTEIRTGIPPQDVPVSPDEWKMMGPIQREAVSAFFRTSAGIAFAAQLAALKKIRIGTQEATP